MAETCACIPSKRTMRNPDRIPARLKDWLLLFVWITIIGVFMLGIGPALLQRSAMRPMARVIEERGIEANMYFYTEVEVFYEANVNMDNTWAYPHRGLVSAQQ